MGALGHYIEREGVATAQVSLIRERRDYHWRHCFSDDGCVEKVPPVGTPIRGRIDTVTYTGGEQ